MADKELLSALMDGHTVDQALIEELEQNVESQDTWKNYHLIGDVMRGESPETVNWNIAESVAAALDAEPAHRSDSSRVSVTDSTIKQIQSDEVGATPHIESQPTPVEVRRQLPAWLTQIGQVGVAACVSLVVIVGVQQYGDSESSSRAIASQPVLQTIPLTGSVEPVSLTRESVSVDKNNDAQLTEQRRRINAMLQDYELQLRLSSEKSSVDKTEIESVIE
ncbi:RseA family anti-sigma factor [Vibrio sp. TH_r3]|uniref:RseA family anti-sigma factor n=1 Tax=Vibrio sp. TH_r3 TaxID=3082084 RepID=UPI002953A5CE|nr:RseA family anti-sigma factor [Vibrio sp. TH_r3]MDV7105168.1 RseA family anti-sigma factor [Vibrio sp. TH_r3]